MYNILLITALLKFQTKSSFAYMLHILLWLSTAHHILLFLLIDFQLNTASEFSSQVCVIFYVKSPSIT